MLQKDEAVSQFLRRIQQSETAMDLKFCSKDESHTSVFGSYFE